MIGSLSDAASVIRQGGVIAYPTESCFGLGCDPGNREAIRRLLRIKRRSRFKGLILVSDHVFRFRPFIQSISEAIPVERLDEIKASWPGPNTWLMPARSHVSSWLKGSHNTLGVRVSRHPVVRNLCRAANMALVSTSANRAGKPALRSCDQVWKALGSEVDFIVKGSIGVDKAPSIIRDALSGMVIRG